MKILVLTVFDDVEGPNIYLKAPEISESDNGYLTFLPNLMDLDEDKFFVHDEAEISSANYPFEVKRIGSRGGFMMLMISVILVNEEIKPKYFRPVLKEFVNDFLSIEDVQEGIKTYNNKIVSTEKANEIEELFYSFYSDLPEETVIIDKNIRVMVYGLPGAGKTSLITQLQENLFSREYSSNITAKKLFFNNLTMTSYDLPVKHMFGKIWNHYVQTQDGFIFMIDSSNPTEFNMVADQLAKVSNYVIHQNLPLLILFNKADACRITLEELKEQFNIIELGSTGFKKFNAFLVSVIDKQGIFESFEWLANKILKKILKTWK